MDAVAYEIMYHIPDSEDSIEHGGGDIATVDVPGDVLDEDARSLTSTPYEQRPLSQWMDNYVHEHISKRAEILDFFPAE
jgi:hypothetical protein